MQKFSVCVQMDWFVTKSTWLTIYIDRCLTQEDFEYIRANVFKQILYPVLFDGRGCFIEGRKKHNAELTLYSLGIHERVKAVHVDFVEV